MTSALKDADGRASRTSTPDCVAMSLIPLRRHAWMSVLALLFAFAAQAEAAPALLVSHLQHGYAGGGSCFDRYWVSWDGGSALQDIDLTIELRSRGRPLQVELLHIDRLGVTMMDHADGASAETGECPDASSRLRITKATAIAGDERIDLLRDHAVRTAPVQTFPLGVASPARRSRNHAAQAPS